MATYKKLMTHKCLNPYFLENSYQLEKIVFYDSNKKEKICTVPRGWLTGKYACNNYGNKSLESLEYKRKVKIDFSSKESFFVGTTLYVNTQQLPSFIFLGKNISYQNDTETSYKNTFKLDGLVYDAEYLGTVKSPLGERIESIYKIFKEHKSQYTIEKLLKNEEKLKELISLLKNA